MSFKNTLSNVADLAIFVPAVADLHRARLALRPQLQRQHRHPVVKLRRSLLHAALPALPAAAALTPAAQPARGSCCVGPRASVRQLRGGPVRKAFCRRGVISHRNEARLNYCTAATVSSYTLDISEQGK